MRATVQKHPAVAARLRTAEPTVPVIPMLPQQLRPDTTQHNTSRHTVNDTDGAGGGGCGPQSDEHPAVAAPSTDRGAHMEHDARVSNQLHLKGKRVETLSPLALMHNDPAAAASDEQTPGRAAVRVSVARSF